jgi:signal transduction histidine kinase
MENLGDDPEPMTLAHDLPARLLRAEGASRLVPDLTLGLLHRLNNVMTSLYFTADGCEAEIEPGHPARELLKVLTASVQEAQHLVKRTADVNLSLGSTEPGYQDLNSLVKADEELTRILLPKGAALKLNTSEAALVVKISISDFRFILFNLAANAKDAMGEVATVQISTSTARELDERAYSVPIRDSLKDGAAFALSDNGHGIPAAVLPQVGSPFFSTRPDRVGLGLYQATRLAERNGGQLLFRSSEGIGTEVVCILPRISEG